MNKILIVIVIIILIGFGFYYFSQDNTSESLDTNAEENLEVVDDKGGIYDTYSPDKLSEYSDRKIVLFFKADWCPSCRALDSDIRSSDLDIPEDLVILSLNYDIETDLKKKYGVTVQHTLVLVDSSGNMIKKWSGGNRLGSIIDQVI